MGCFDGNQDEGWEGHGMGFPEGIWVFSTEEWDFAVNYLQNVVFFNFNVWKLAILGR